MTSAIEKKSKAAKLIRVLTIPPVLVSALLVAVFTFVTGVFDNAFQLVACITYLGIIPALAYPLQPHVPKFKDMDKRQGQRKLAFITSPIGYALGFAYAFITDASNGVKFIFTGYLISVIMLLVFNKILKIHASGHACGSIGPLLYAFYFLGTSWLLPLAALCVGVVWSSLKLGRHTAKELALGGACALISFCLGIVLL